MGKLELKWGAIVGGIYLAWLYLSFYLGMHTNGLGMIQVMTVISLLLTVTGFTLALGAVVRRKPEITWGEGMRSSALIALVAAAIAAVTQVGYFKLVNPAWTATMVEETGAHYRAQDMEEAQVVKMMEGAEKTFGMASYVIQAATGTFLIGMIASAVIMAFLRRARRA